MDDDPTIVIVDGQLRYDFLDLSATYAAMAEGDIRRSPEYQALIKRMMRDQMHEFWSQHPVPRPEDDQW